jgi:hypothetical protein
LARSIRFQRLQLSERTSTSWATDAVGGQMSSDVLR